MKVKELIQKLKKENPEMSIVKGGYEGGYDDVSGLGSVKIERDVNDEWYYGNHESNECGEECVLI